MQPMLPPKPAAPITYRCKRCQHLMQVPYKPGQMIWAFSCPRCGGEMVGDAQPGMFPQGPPPPMLPPPPPDAYGSRLAEYKNLGIVGLVMMLLGPIFFFPGWGPYGIVAAISLIFIGFLCGITGLTGWQDERKKFGVVRIHTPAGYAAAFFGIICVSTAQVPGLSFLFAAICIPLGRIAYKQGDLENGEIGIYCGVIGIICGIIFIVLFML